MKINVNNLLAELYERDSSYFNSELEYAAFAYFSKYEQPLEYIAYHSSVEDFFDRLDDMYPRCNHGQFIDWNNTPSTVLNNVYHSDFLQSDYYKEYGDGGFDIYCRDYLSDECRHYTDVCNPGRSYEILLAQSLNNDQESIAAQIAVSIFLEQQDFRNGDFDVYIVDSGEASILLRGGNVVLELFGCYILFE